MKLKYTPILSWSPRYVQGTPLSHCAKKMNKSNYCSTVFIREVLGLGVKEHCLPTILSASAVQAYRRACLSLVLCPPCV